LAIGAEATSRTHGFVKRDLESSLHERGRRELDAKRALRKGNRHSAACGDRRRLVANAEPGSCEELG
jgi:hypothetical protein